MLVSPAFAQSAGGGGTDILMSILPLVLIFAIMWFLIIRPQKQKVKQHQEMVNSLRRGDVVITAGGLIGKVSKVVDDRELQVEVADGVRVRVARHMIHEVRSKSEPVSEDTSKKK